MGEPEIECNTLLISWVLMIIGFWPVVTMGHIGLVIGLVPIVLGQVIRAKHDKAQLDEFRRRQGPMLFAALYWLALAGLTIAVRMRGMKLDEIPLGVAVLLFSGPLIVAMVVGDIKVCSRSSRKK